MGEEWREGERVENRGRDEFGKANPKDIEELRSGEFPSSRDHESWSEIMQWGWRGCSESETSLEQTMNMLVSWLWRLMAAVG